MHFRSHFLMYTLVPLFIICVGAAFFRFMVVHDYLVAYEGECDPMTESCFIGCEDDECTETYYYMEVEKYAPDLLKQCGDHIEECEAANVCIPIHDTQCSITYCDPVTDGDSCETLPEEGVIDDTP